jgi:hypothetical protein
MNTRYKVRLNDGKQVNIVERNWLEAIDTAIARYDLRYDQILSVSSPKKEHLIFNKNI